MRRNSEKTKTTGITTISWVDEIRSLGVFVTRSRKFKCSIDNAKRSYHRAANGIFGKVGRLASEEVVVQLLLHKCMPILLYALEVCALEKRSVQSLDFTINCFFMKLFKTSSIATVRDCQSFFGVDLPSIVLAKEKDLINLLIDRPTVCCTTVMFS